MTISGNTRVFAVLGQPVAHSLSPIMHNAWVAAAGLDGVYVALAVDERCFADFAGLGLAGANVTTPFKAAALEAAHELSLPAKALGAVNTLWRDPDGRWRGENTDAEGFVLGLDQAVPGWKAAVKTALVLGAGGAGRAIALGLVQAGVARVLLANRSHDRAVAAMAGTGAQALAWAEAAQAARSADLLVNATHFETPWASLEPILAAAPAGAIAGDAVYRPRITPFLAAAEQKGMKGVDGLYMLAGQGALAFRHWFGIDPDQPTARALMLDELARRADCATT